MTFSATAGADEEDDLDRPDVPPLAYSATQTVDYWSMTAGVLWFPWPEATLRPYIGGGAGQSFRDWELRETTAQNQVVISESRETDRDTAFVAYGTVGIEAVLSKSWALTTEVQYSTQDDFHGVDLDGVSVFGGIRWRF